MTGHNRFSAHYLAILLILIGETWVAAQNDTTAIRLDSAVIEAHNEMLKPIDGGFVVDIQKNFSVDGLKINDVFKRLPSINISPDGVINMSGRSAVKVYIDNREIRMTGKELADYLNSFPASRLKSVTVLNMPGAEYDAENNIGVIRITTKHSFDGFRGNATLSYGQNTYSSIMGDLWLSYTSERSFFDVIIDHSDISSKNVLNTTHYYPGAVVQEWNPRRWDILTSSASITTGYRFSEKTNLIADLRIPIQDRQITTDIENETRYMSSISGPIDSVLLSKGSAETIRGNVGIGLDFTHDFNEKVHLTVAGDYLSSQSNSSRVFNSQSISFGEISETTPYSSRAKLDNDIFTAKMDVAFPILGFAGKAGVKSTYIKTESDNIFSVENDVIDLFEYKENIQAAYLNVSRRWKSISASLGFRGEYTQTDSWSESMKQRHENNTFNLFPSASLMYTIGEKDRISISHNTRVQRPQYSYMDPFRHYISKFSYSTGNPFLTHSIIHNSELTWYHGDSFQSRLFHTAQNDQIGKLVILDPDDMTTEVEMPNNMLDTDIIGLSMYKYLRPVFWYTASMSGSLSWQQYRSDSQYFKNQSGWSSSITMSNWIYIKRKLLIGIDLSESTPGLYSYRIRKNAFSADLSASYTFSKSGLTVKIAAYDIFNTATPQYYYYSNGVKMQYDNFNDNRCIKIDLSWSFGKSSRTHSGRTASNTEEADRL